MYDITRPASLARARHWAAELRANASNARVVVLVGNKADQEEQRAVSQREAEELAARWGCCWCWSLAAGG